MTALAESTRTMAQFGWNVLIGIGAAFVVPVFLQTVSSSILTDLYKMDSSKPYVPLVFASYCVLGAISAKRLIQTVSDKIFDLAKEAKKDAAQAKEQTASTEKKVAAVTQQQQELKTAVAAATDAVQYQLTPQTAPKSPALEAATRQRGLQFSDEEFAAALKTDDPWKGRFRGQSERNGRRLRAELTPLSDKPGWTAVTLHVESTDPKNPLTEPIELYLHPTVSSKPVVPFLRNGTATLTILTWGAFTVGALADQGETALELDLSNHPDARDPWKSR